MPAVAADCEVAAYTPTTPTTPTPTMEAGAVRHYLSRPPEQLSVFLLGQQLTDERQVVGPDRREGSVVVTHRAVSDTGQPIGTGCRALAKTPADRFAALPPRPHQDVARLAFPGPAEAIEHVPTSELVQLEFAGEQQARVGRRGASREPDDRAETQMSDERPDRRPGATVPGIRIGAVAHHA